MESMIDIQQHAHFKVMLMATPRKKQLHIKYCVTFCCEHFFWRPNDQESVKGIKNQKKCDMTVLDK